MVLDGWKITHGTPVRTQENVWRFDEVAGRHPSAQRRPMFGYPALFVGGNYAAGLFAELV